MHGTVYTTQHCTEQQNQTCTATLMLIILPITDSSPITRHPTNNGAHDKTRACAINMHDATGAARYHQRYHHRAVNSPAKAVLHDAMPTWLAKGRLAMNWLTAPKRAETLAMANHGGVRL